ncbi:MAG TPA: replication initiator [Gemmatimonadales bacterium]
MVVPAGAVVMLTLTAPALWDHEALEAWNAALPRAWNRTCQRLRRHHGVGQYFAVREYQQRGALHVHALLRPARPERPWRIDLDRVRADATAEGFGPQLMVSMGGPLAAYAAKYVAKTLGMRAERASRTGRRWRVWTCSREWIPGTAAARAAQRPRGGLESLPRSYTGEVPPGAMLAAAIRAAMEGLGARSAPDARRPGAWRWRWRRSLFPPSAIDAEWQVLDGYEGLLLRMQHDESKGGEA